MHALTSSIFLHTYLPLLTIPERRALLHAYILITFQFAVARGRPMINPGLLMSQSVYPTAPGTEVKPFSAPDALSDPANKTSRNSWLSLIESALYAKGEHCISHRVWQIG
jgi:hypothetical protein